MLAAETTSCHCIVPEFGVNFSRLRFMVNPLRTVKPHKPSTVLAAQFLHCPSFLAAHLRRFSTSLGFARIRIYVRLMSSLIPLSVLENIDLYSETCM